MLRPLVPAVLTVLAAGAAAQSAPVAADGPADMASRNPQPAYVDGRVTHYKQRLEPAQDAPYSARRPLYQVVHPEDSRSRGLRAPQCDPCDHTRNGVDATDRHDHVLGAATRRGVTTRWHVFEVAPATSGDATRDAAILDAYSEQLPARSTGDVSRLLATRLPDGSPVARLTDDRFSFLGTTVRARGARPR